MTSDFYRPTEIDLLRMENDLLTHEIRFLKARLHDVGQDDSAAGNSGNGQRATVGRDVVAAVESAVTPEVSAAKMERLRQAERDIKIVMNSIQRRRFVRLYLKRRPGYQTLLQRYGKARENGQR